MTPTVYRVRELVVSYAPTRRSLPISAIGRLTTPRDAAVLASALLADATVETVLALHLTTKHDLIGVHVVSTGTLDAAIVHPREVFKAALLSNAAGLLLVHNHPSGDPTPSPDDRALVTRLRAAGALLGVELLDALIVTDRVDRLRYFSFREAGGVS
jgi:DNA repair protein RadC